jgi:uncharacterized protein
MRFPQGAGCPGTARVPPEIVRVPPEIVRDWYAPDPGRVIELNTGLNATLNKALNKEMAMRVRKTPIRTCVICRQSFPKKRLVRIVRTPAGHVAVDRTGKASGRGAYVCPEPECLLSQKAQRQLSRALEAPLIGPVGEALARDLQCWVQPDGAARDQEP